MRVSLVSELTESRLNSPTYSAHAAGLAENVESARPPIQASWPTPWKSTAMYVPALAIRKDFFTHSAIGADLSIKALALDLVNAGKSADEQIGFYALKFPRGHAVQTITGLRDSVTGPALGRWLRRNTIAVAADEDAHWGLEGVLQTGTYWNGCRPLVTEGLDSIIGFAQTHWTHRRLSAESRIRRTVWREWSASRDDRLRAASL